MSRSYHSDPADSDTEDLVLRLEKIVRCRTGSRIHGLQISVLDDEVILSGKASSYYAKQLATHAALEQIRDRSLKNAIDVC